MTGVRTVTLAEFLLARIAADETDAAGCVGQHWNANEFRRVRTAAADNPAWTTVVSWGGTDEHWEPPRPKEYGTTFGHIARHDPARVLAECEAKRRIVELHETDTTPGVGGLPRPFCGGCGTDEYPGIFPCDTLRLLALPYADHPDYRDEWKP